MNISQLLADELSLTITQIQNVLALFAEGGTVPFIARYRKERTGELNEIVLRDIQDRYEYLTELEDRKKTILDSITEQGKLTDELRQQIESCLNKTELEDLYLPYRPKRRTRATIARENGLEPLALLIKEHNQPGAPEIALELEALKFISEDGTIKTIVEALQGASDILAEEVSEKAELRAHLRNYFLNDSVVVAQIKDEFPLGTTKFEMYRDYRVPVKDIAPHNMLALRRGENEGVLTFNFEFDDAHVQQYLEAQELHTDAVQLRKFYQEMLADAFDRLMKTSLLGEVRLEKKKYSDVVSIQNFEANFRELLLSSPAGMKPTLGVDPGFRTGCKVAAIDETGKFVGYETVFPHQSENERARAADTLRKMIKRHNVSLIAIGNGTAGRETDAFVTEVIKELDTRPIKVMVNESGASIYSASQVAIDEFPDLDLTVRGAISIARRLQDPLAELVKIDPKSIGVGQYQHDVDQKLLKKKLEETVESCVNFVGVDLNTASKELLSYVAGINSSVAKNIVSFRDEHGAFRSRQDLMKVPKFGPKTFEQASGFLRIRGGVNPLDNSAVHPESYPIVERIAADLNVPLTDITRIPDQIQNLDIRKYVTADVGEPTLADIKNELLKPGRDPRAEFRYATFNEEIKEITDLAPGMILEGTITNVTNFGAFVDIGVHQDGLVHISQMSAKFVDDTTKVVKVGQIVKVRVVEVNVPLKRISLSMRLNEPTVAKPKAPAAVPQAKPQATGKSKPAPAQPAKKHATIDDLMAKFNRNRG